MTNAALLTDLAAHAQGVQAFLRTFYDKKLAQAKTTDVIAGETMEIIRDFVVRPGGKCVRSYIAKTAYEMAGGTDTAAITAVGAAIEINHYFLLSVDDVADRDTVRHGGPTIEVMYKQKYTHIPADQRDHYARSFTEVANALMYSHVYELLYASGFTAKQIKSVVPIMTDKMLAAPATGWVMHLLENHESLADVTEKRFLEALTFVTATYTFVAPALVGLTLAGADDNTRDIATQYGLQVGTAFQIYDDILGLFGDPKKTGKSAGNDVREGKKTVHIQRAYALASAEDKAFMDSVVGSNLSEEDLERLREIVKSTGALKYAQDKAQAMVDVGIAALQPLKATMSTEHIEKLEQLAQFVISREK